MAVLPIARSPPSSNPHNAQQSPPQAVPIVRLPRTLACGFCKLGGHDPVLLVVVDERHDDVVVPCKKQEVSNTRGRRQRGSYTLGDPVKEERLAIAEEERWKGHLPGTQ